MCGMLCSCCWHVHSGGDLGVKHAGVEYCACFVCMYDDQERVWTTWMNASDNAQYDRSQ